MILETDMDNKTPNSIIMKNLKFLFVTFILTCFVGIAQIDAQVIITRGENTPDWPKPVHYEVDGVYILADAVGDYQWIITPANSFQWLFKGYIYAAYGWDEASGDYVLLDPIPLPKRTYIYYDPGLNNEKVTITPSGIVTVVVQVKDFVAE